MRNDLYSYSNDYINRWVISYADFITMLLALFVVLYALTSLDSNKLKNFSSSVMKHFPQNKEESTLNPSSNLQERKQMLAESFSTTKVNVKFNNEIEINSNKTLQSVRTDKDLTELNSIENLIKNKLADVNGLSITHESRGLIIRLKDAVLFDAGSDIIKDKAQITLDRLAGVLKDIPNSIRIEGHTDSNPISTAKFPSNWELSTARSTNIVKYLIKKHKFNPRNLQAVGYGEYMPLTKNSNSSDQAVNRRVDIVILNSGSKIFEPSSN